jgi:hypothetical protein
MRMFIITAEFEEINEDEAVGMMARLYDMCASKVDMHREER